VRPPRKVQEGDPIEAGAYNALAAIFERFLNMEAAPGGYLRMDKGPSGTALALLVPQGVMARLSGTTSPYDWEEVEPVSGGTWATFTGGRSESGNAYELNGAGGLGGTVQRIRWTGAGDWRFQAQRWGPDYPNPCGASANSLTFTLTGCNSCAVPGATVDFVRSGVILHSTTTNSSGVATYTNPPPGSYSINWSITGQGHSYSGTATTSIASNCTSAAQARSIVPGGVPPTGYSCTTSCVFPLPPLFITDSEGTRANSTCIIHTDGRPVLASFGATGNCASPQWTMIQSWLDAPCTCAQLLTASNCVVQIGCGQKGHSGGGAIISAGCPDPFVISGSYSGTPAVCGFDPPSSPPLSGGFTVHT
jgi:hypothetical protein